MSELKPCPFCGNKYPTVCKTKQKDGWRPFYYVLCDYGNDGCGASGQWNHEEEDAIEAWNRRPGRGRKELNMKYRKKPVVIEAYQTDKELDIETLEGTMHASVGDYIITGVRGEQYPCKPDIFEQTYEPADASASPWHRVEDGLPPKATWVLTVATDENVRLFNIATVDAGGQWWTCSPQNILRELFGVRYWMPIEPPKEDA